MHVLIILALVPLALSGALVLWYMAKIFLLAVWVGLKMSFQAAWGLVTFLLRGLR